MSLRDVNARGVALYMEHRPAHLEASLQGSDEPYDHKARGSTRPPVPEGAFAWMDDGLYFHEVVGEDELRPVSERWRALSYQSALNAVIEAYRHGIERYGKIPYSRIVEDCWRYPAAVARWEEEQGSEWRAFESLCSRIANDFAGMHPRVVIRVNVNPKDEHVSTKREAANRDRTADAQHTWRKIVSEIERLEREEDYSREAAKAEAARRFECSVPKVKRALEFVKVEREGEVA